MTWLAGCWLTLSNIDTIGYYHVACDKSTIVFSIFFKLHLFKKKTEPKKENDNKKRKPKTLKATRVPPGTRQFTETETFFFKSIQISKL